jgi:hypothetical protein
VELYATRNQRNVMVITRWSNAARARRGHPRRAIEALRDLVRLFGPATVSAVRLRTTADLCKAKSKISVLDEGDMRPDQVKIIARRLGVT